MRRTTKKLQLRTETLHQLDDAALGGIHGGDRTERTDARPAGKLRTLFGCKPGPEPAPRPPIQSWNSCGSCIGLQCPAGTNKTVIGCVLH